MSKEKAKAYYTDKRKDKKLNCAQAVIAAFRDKFPLDENSVALFASFGSGRAPEGACGAFYAAKFILGAADRKDDIEKCRSIFLSKAGSIKCKEIRQGKKLSCVECIETASEFLEGVKQGNEETKAMKHTFNVKQFIAGNHCFHRGAGKAAALEMISPKAAYELIAKDPAVKLLDVRSAMEYNEIHIKDSINIPIDMLAGKINEFVGAGKTYIVLCRTGNRSPMAADMLVQSGLPSVKVMNGGITRWRKERLPAERGQGGISLERQVRIIAGSLILSGILLSIFVNPWFLGISIFISSGLIFAGVTDNCMMGILLMKLPYNKKLYKVKSSGGTCAMG